MRKYDKNPRNFDREVEMLYEAGVDSSEIANFRILREKQDILERKWD